MNKHIAIVIATILIFLGLIIAYTMTPPDAPDTGKASAAAAKQR